MNKAHAAALWDQLEQELIRIGLPRDGRLERARAQLIRTIGEANGVDVEGGERRRVGSRKENTLRLPDQDNLLGAPAGVRIAPRRRTGPKGGDLRGADLLKTPPSKTGARRIDRAATISDERWALMIERACMGYSGDDEVEY